MKTLLKNNWPTVGAVLGTLLGVILAIALRGAVEESHSNYSVQSVPKSPQQIVADHTTWADGECRSGLAPQMTELRSFFAEARRNTRPFAEEVLSFDSKLKLVSEKLFGGDEHRRFVEQAFERHLFAAGRLDQMVESNVRQYVRHLDDVESQLLVRLQSDLATLPPELLPGHAVDSERLHGLLSDALREALAQVHAEFQGSAAFEAAGWVAGEVLTVAVTRLAVSAGILGTSATAGLASFGASIVVGLIVDAIVSWIYDEVYDPAGELSRMLDRKLTQLEELIISGDGTTPGLLSRLSDYAERRSAARRQALDAAVTSPTAAPALAF